MTTFTDRLDLPYPRQQVFELVADIESYPLFLPHMRKAHIRARHRNTWLVDQVVHFRLFDLPFSTQATLDPPSSIHIVCDDGRLGRFVEDWVFEDRPDGGTHLVCTTTFRSHFGLFERLLGNAATEMHQKTIQAFAARARAMFR